MSDPGPPDEPADPGQAETTTPNPIVRRAGRDFYQAGRDLHVHHRDGVRRVASAAYTETACPYPGLAAFTGQQAEWFYGRDRLTADLLERMDERLVHGGPVMVVAASGAGKSSLLRAGLLHRISRGSLPAEGSRHWPQVWFTPGSRPIRNAAAALAAAWPDGTNRPVMPSDPGPADLDRLLRSVLATSAGRPSRVIVVVDQLEELFTLCESEAERRAFITWLWRAAGGDDPRSALALVACGLRADFYAECVSGYPQLRQSLEDGQIIVGPMSGDELRQAIGYPAEAAGLDIEPGLTDLLLADLRAGYQGREPGRGDLAADYNAGRLPLLAHALRATWQQRHGAVLTLDGYRATGGIEHAIARTAEQVYTGLTEDGQRASRVMFLRLVKIGASASEDVRRPATRSGLTSGVQSAGVIDAYTSSRLLTTARDAVQITHEALLTAWPRLADWLEEDRADSLKRQAVEDAATEWEHAGHDSSLLYRGARLENTVAWAGGRSRELTQTARAFLAASQRLAHRVTLVWRSIVALLAVLALGASLLAAVALHQRATANSERAQALSAGNLAASDAMAGQSQATGDADPVMARLEAVAAWRIQPTARARYAILSAAFLPWAALMDSADGTSVTAVAFSPHGKLLATGTFGGTIQLCDLATKTPCTLLPGTPHRVTSVAFSPDGKLLAAGTFDGMIKFFDITSRQPAFTLPAGTGNTVYSVAFSPDGRLLAAGIESRTGLGSTQLWNVAARTLTATLPAVGSLNGVNSVSSVAFSSDGKLLAAGTGAGEVQLWDLTGSAPEATAPAITGGDVNSVALSHDGTLLVAGLASGNVQLWDLASRTLEATLPADSSHAVFSVALSPDGKLLAADTGSATTQVWDLASRTLKAALPAGSLDSAVSVAFSADSDLLATGTLTGTRLSHVADDLAISSPVATLPIGAPGSVTSVALSPDGKLLAASTGDGTVQLWDVTARTLRATLSVRTNSLILPVAFSPDGKFLAVGNGDGTVQLWDVTTRTLRATLNIGAKSLIWSVAFSPDGKLLGASAGNGAVRLWDATVRVPAVRATLPTGTDEAIESLTFSPGSQALAASTGNGTVQLWDVMPRRPTMTATLHAGITNEVWSVAFSPDGKLLAAVTVSGTVRLWNVGTGHQASTAPILTNGLSTVAFGADSTTLAIGNGQGVQLWDTSTGQKIGALPVNSFDSLLHGNIIMAASAKNALLAVGTGVGSIQLWSIPYLTDIIPYLCALAGQPFPRAQWANDAPGVPYMATCP